MQLRWRDSFGIIVTTISALGLVLAVWQVARLNSEAGIDAASLTRERMAVTMSGRIVAAMQTLFAYQHAVVLRDDPRTLAPLRRDTGTRLAAIIRDFTSGDASSIAPEGRVTRIWTTWQRAANVAPGPAGDAAIRAVVVALEGAMTGMEDASNLTYDPSMVTQNLADIRIVESPIALAAIARVQTLADLAIHNNGMSLSERIAAANSVSGLRTTTDLSIDNVGILPARLASLMPARAAEFSRLSTTADGLYQEGSAYADRISNAVLLRATPNASKAEVDLASAHLTARVHEAFDAFGAALDAALVSRGQIQNARAAYYYLALVFGALLLVGLMIALAQFVASRDRRLVREARAEASRLSAELARQRAEHALRLSEAQFRAVFEGAAVGIAVIDRRGILVDANGVFRAMFGTSLATALAGHDAALREVLAGDRETFEFEQHVGDGETESWTDATVSVVNGADNAPLFAIAMFRDKTELKASERRMLHDQLHDALTGLPNRAFFEQRLHRRFHENGAPSNSFFAVLFVDLEHFRDVNESLGRQAGDAVLTQVAQRLRASVDARDVVARLASDEFAVLVHALGDTLHVESLARRVLNALSKPLKTGVKDIFLGASVGIAVGSSTYDRAEDVMRDAEVAMQHAKSSGGSRFALFDSKMRAIAQKRLQLITDLRLAIERGEFRLLYQPIVRIEDGRLVACEALLRWHHPSAGVLNPTEFVPIAEQNGLASLIGRYVIQTAAEQLAAWRGTKAGARDFTMHVNVSAAELNDAEFETNLIAVVERAGLSPSDFSIEITENVVLDTGTRANITLERVRSRGFGICIDDFGTGYSSLRYLQQFNVDAMKIDRSFVTGADGDLASEPIVRTLMALADAFDVAVVAEGVESVRQRELLYAAGVRYAQGFLYGRALTAAEMSERYEDVLGRISRSASA